MSKGFKDVNPRSAGPWPGGDVRRYWGAAHLMAARKQREAERGLR